MKDLRKELHTLQRLITPDYAGILWMTNGPLKKELSYYEALDYLVDGAFELLFQNKVHEQSNLVMGKSFGHSFFVAHFNLDAGTPKFTETLKLISPENIQHTPKVLLLGDLGLELENKIKEENPELRFEILIA